MSSEPETRVAKWSKTKQMLFDFDDFESLEDKTYVSPPVECHGIMWRLHLFPFGNHTDDIGHHEYPSFFLECLDIVKGAKESVSTKYSFSFLFVTGSPVKTHTFCKNRERLLFSNFLKRQTLLSECLAVGRTLPVRVDIALLEPIVKPVWRPEKCLSKTIASLWGSEEHSDVTISLDDADGSSIAYKAHKLILSLASPVLKDLMEEHKTAEAIPLAGVDPALFEALLFFLYNEELPAGFSVSDSGFGLVKLANRLGCTKLKLVLEAELVESAAITIENAAEVFAFADSNSLAQLKESAKDLISDFPALVRASDGWNTLKQSANLMEELFAEVINRTEGAGAKPRVSLLRKRLSDAGEDADGTYEMLTKRVKTLKDGE